MRFPDKDAHAGVLITLGDFAVCTIGDEEEPAHVREHATGLAVHVRILRETVAVRNHALDKVTHARALRQNAERRAGQWLRQLGRDANAVFAGKTKSLEYLRILPMAPSKMLAQALDARVASLGKVIQALDDAATPAKLKHDLEVGRKLHLTWKARHEAVAAALHTVDNARREIRVAREGWFVAYRSAYGGLVKDFASDPALVDTYFDDPPRRDRGSAADPQEVGDANKVVTPHA